MNLLEYAIETEELLENCSAKEFSSIYIKRKGESFDKYSHWTTPSKKEGGEDIHHYIITSNSHGIDFFKNVIKYWDDPHGYYQIMKKNGKGEPTDEIDKSITDYTLERTGDKTDYEYNFVRLLLLNKQNAN